MNIFQYVASDTYRSLVIMAETLSRMSDMERKLEVVHFSKESRSLFVRLVAVTQWALSSQLYEQTESSINTIEQNSSIFVDTADRLFQIAHVQLPYSTYVYCVTESLSPAYP